MRNTLCFCTIFVVCLKFSTIKCLCFCQGGGKEDLDFPSKAEAGDRRLGRVSFPQECAKTGTCLQREEFPKRKRSSRRGNGAGAANTEKVHTLKKAGSFCNEGANGRVRGSSWEKAGAPPAESLGCPAKEPWKGCPGD